MPEGHILWTHATSPFVDTDTYTKMINTYFSILDKYDSLMTVSKIQKFIWDNSDAINYNRIEEKWPRTQTLQPLWEVNSGAFISSKEIYADHCDRIGHKPYFFELSDYKAHDIDWMIDFKIAEELYKFPDLSELKEL